MLGENPINDDRAPTVAQWLADAAHNPTAPINYVGGAAAVAVDKPWPIVPGYEIVKQLGRGGMGEVYLAKDPDGHLFALKTIRADRVSSVFLERFLREKNALLDLYHPHVVRIFYAGKSDEDNPFFTMPYCARGTLADHMAEFKARPRDAVELMIHVAEAVHYLHQQGHIHRDLKPQNILLGDNGEPYVSDFGLVKDAAAASTGESQLDCSSLISADVCMSKAETTPHGARGDRETPTFGAVGTLPYMAPEQLLRHNDTIGPRSDIWALGVMLYELLSGGLPFDSETPEIVSSLIKSEPPHPMRLRKPTIAPRLERVVMKCLAKEPRNRYQTGAELASALRSALAPRRRMMIAAVAMLVITTAAFGARLLWPDQPKERSLEQRRAALVERLQRGEKVVIVGDDGKPDYYHFWEGEQGANLRNWKGNGAFTLDTPTDVLMEIVPPGACPHGFRLTAAVRINHGHMHEGRGGFYHGHNRREENPGRRHVFAEFSFVEFTPSGRKAIANGPNAHHVNDRIGSWKYSLRHFADAPAMPVSSSTSILKDGLFFTRWPGINEEEPWRPMILEVTPARTTIQWGDEPPREMDTVHNAVLFANFLKNVDRHPIGQTPLSFGPEMGCGFFVHQASVSFRSVTVEPFPPAERR